MLHLCHVLKLIINGLYYGSFSEQHLVGDAHKRVLHLVFKLGYQPNAIYEEFAEQVFADVATVTDQFAVSSWGKRSTFSGSRSSTLPGVNIKLTISPISLQTICRLKP